VAVLRERLLGSRDATFLAAGSIHGEGETGADPAAVPLDGATRLLEVDDTLGTIGVLRQLLAEVTTPYVVVAPAEGELVAKTVGGLVEALDGTGFALASGNILHTATTGNRRAPELAASHASDRVADMCESTELFADLDLANKVFRTELLREAVDLCAECSVEHPATVTLAAGLRAGPTLIAAAPAIAVPFPTESAAVRRRRSTTDNLRSAVATVEAGDRVLRALGEDTLLEQWRAHTLGTLLSVYYPLVPRVDVGYWTSLSEAVRRAADGVSEETLARIGLHNRILVHLIIEGRRADAETVSYFRSDYGSGSRVDLRDGVAYFAPGYLRDLSEPVPAELLVC